MKESVEKSVNNVTLNEKISDESEKEFKKNHERRNHRKLYDVKLFSTPDVDV